MIICVLQHTYQYLHINEWRNIHKTCHNMTIPNFIKTDLFRTKRPTFRSEHKNLITSYYAEIKMNREECINVNNIESIAGSMGFAKRL